MCKVLMDTTFWVYWINLPHKWLLRPPPPPPLIAIMVNNVKGCGDIQWAETGIWRRSDVRTWNGAMLAFRGDVSIRDLQQCCLRWMSCWVFTQTSIRETAGVCYTGRSCFSAIVAQGSLKMCLNCWWVSPLSSWQKELLHSVPKAN